MHYRRRTKVEAYEAFTSGDKIELENFDFSCEKSVDFFSSTLEMKQKYSNLLRFIAAKSKFLLVFLKM